MKLQIWSEATENKLELIQIFVESSSENCLNGQKFKRKHIKSISEMKLFHYFKLKGFRFYREANNRFFQRPCGQCYSIIQPSVSS